MGGQPNFALCLAVSWAGTLYIHFLGLLLPYGISPRAKFTLHPSLVFAYIGSVTADQAGFISFRAHVKVAYRIVYSTSVI